MIFKSTTKHCRISPGTQKYIDQHLKKITQNLPAVDEDLVVVRLTLRKNIDKYHPSRSRPHTHKSYADTKPALAYFEGSMTFRLDKKQLYVHFKGQTIEECVDQGFHLIFKELEKYKDLHFPADSEYPDHHSIRGKYA